ncbi:MAG: exodeoxyribonuclease VII small subunit [Pseudomonadota bacterium]
MQQSQEIASLSFEQAMRELEIIVRKLESGQGELESSIADYERGQALKEHCGKKLADAKMKVEKIIQAKDGTLQVSQFEA